MAVHSVYFSTILAHQFGDNKTLFGFFTVDQLRNVFGQKNPKFLSKEKQNQTLQQVEMRSELSQKQKCM